MADKDEKRLYNLEEIDYKVESDDPDVRGWPVKGSDNKTVGIVDDLLVNKDLEKVLYLDVDVDESILEGGHDPLEKPADEGTHEYVNKEGEDHLIIPIGMARVAEDEKCVQCDNIDYQTFAGAKRFKKGQPIDSEYERYLIERYDENYNWEDVDDDDLYKS
ncbi:MAG TPA: hypothetical protein VK106_01155, partial [Balneolaceae bacterium]|nr:hypothetical protein [Balneolaceae bacterium]